MSAHNDTTVLIADPPWTWDDKLPGTRGATAHMLPHTIEQISQAELPYLHEHAVLFLWRPASRLRDALDVCAKWGFAYKTEMVWIKTTVHGNRAFGMGRIVRGEHETCIVATRGKPEVADHSVRSTFSAPMRPYAKPDEFYDLVGKLYPTPYTWIRSCTDWAHGWQLQKGSGMYAKYESKRPSAMRKAQSVAPLAVAKKA